MCAYYLVHLYSYLYHPYLYQCTCSIGTCVHKYPIQRTWRQATWEILSPLQKQPQPCGTASRINDPFEDFIWLSHLYQLMSRKLLALGLDEMILSDIPSYRWPSTLKDQVPQLYLNDFVVYLIESNAFLFSIMSYVAYQRGYTRFMIKYYHFCSCSWMTLALNNPQRLICN